MYNYHNNNITFYSIYTDHEWVVETQQTSEITSWINSLCLSNIDHMVLNDGQRLTANHICAAQRLLKAQFPAQNGLRDTHYLHVYNEWDSDPDDFVQILFVDSCHWVCLSNVYCEDGCVDLYDSMVSDPPEDGSIVRQACTILKSLSLSFVKINLVIVTQQVGGTDCALFAIAFATDHCLKNDPFHSRYDQGEMRSHLERSFESGLMTQFPFMDNLIVLDASKRVCGTVFLEIHCICCQPEAFRLMVYCDNCGMWFHKDCVTHGNESLNSDEDDEWFCSKCTYSGKQMEMCT